MKTIGNILLLILFVALLGLFYLVGNYFFFNEKFSFEAKLLGTIFGGIVFTPIIGRIIHVYRDGKKK